MKVLVAGQSGQLAQALAEVQPRDMRVIFMGRGRMDIRNPDHVARQVYETQPDLIINAAAWTDVDGAETHAKAAFDLNVMGPLNLAAAADACHCPLLHISTDYVFDGTLGRAYVETDAPAPLNIYGCTKSDGDRTVLQSGRHLVLRVPWLHSPWGSNFVTAILKAAAKHDSLDVVSDQVGTPIYAPDAASLIFDIVRSVKFQKFIPGLFHLGHSESVTRADLARFILAHSAMLGGPNATIRDISTAARNDPAQRPLNSRLDGSRLTRFYGLSAGDWREGVKSTVERVLAGR